MKSRRRGKTKHRTASVPNHEAKREADMRKHLLGAAAITSLFVYGTAFAADGPAALAGHVTSAKEGAMEGVIVSAHRDGSRLTISVATDAKGEYSFPAAKLEPGHYRLSIRAVGYDLAGPDAAEVTAGSTHNPDLRLVPTHDLAAQLSNAEWIASMPGSDTQKKFLLSCNSCHSYQRIVNSKHTADEFLQLFQRMAGYYPGSMPTHPQRLVGTARRNLGGGMAGTGNAGGESVFEQAAKWLATVNLSQGPHTYALKTLPRPSGRATHMIVTEYDLPRKTIEPHDVIVDRDGMVWYSDFGALDLGKMDPKTGEVTQYKIPEIKPGFPVGTLDLEQDPDGNLWVAMMYQGGIARLDPKTGKVTTWSVPQEWQTDATQQSFLSPTAMNVDGKVWVKNSDRAQILRMDPETGKWENFGTFKDPDTGRTIGSYGINATLGNKLFMLDFNSGDIGILDGATKKLEIHRTAIAHSRPRRGRVDAEGRLWFAEYDGDAIGVLDPKTKQIKEWQAPLKWSNPYDAVLDKNGDVWSASMMNDRVLRLNTKTGQFTQYLLPRFTNARRVFVDDSTDPVTFWVGSAHGASIVKLEPTD
jgi:streptogramin lyase